MKYGFAAICLSILSGILGCAAHTFAAIAAQ